MDGSRLLIDIIDTTEVYNKQELQEWVHLAIEIHLLNMTVHQVWVDQIITVDILEMVVLILCMVDHMEMQDIIEAMVINNKVIIGDMEVLMETIGEVDMVILMEIVGVMDNLNGDTIHMELIIE